MNKTILLTAGGSGGHLFPAQALASELARRGWTVELATDERADRFGEAFPARKIHVISSETLRGRSPVSLVKTAYRLARGLMQSRAVIGALQPSVVVGFGGYPTFPPMFAARQLGVPSILHEANGVMGRANKMLARGATAIATSVPIEDLPVDISVKSVETGNPVRDTVIAVSGVPYQVPEADGPFNLLVFGGSQGARFFSDLLPEALRLAPEAVRSRIKLVQQCRPEDLERVRTAFSDLGAEVELAGFFKDMPERIVASHLVVCRAGASSVSELTVLGRPSILVPLPGALDQDQSANAKGLGKARGAWPIRQIDLTPQRLASEFERFMTAPDMLDEAARNALAQGKPDAVVRLADLVEDIADNKKLSKGDGA